MDSGIYKGSIILKYNNLKGKDIDTNFFGSSKIDTHQTKVLHSTYQLLKTV